MRLRRTLCAAAAGSAFGLAAFAMGVPPTADITISSDKSCYKAGDPVVVTVSLSNISGGAAFGSDLYLNYDKDHLAITNSGVTTGTLFTQVLMGGPTIDSMNGKIEYHVSVPLPGPMDPPAPGTTADGSIAVLTFTTTSEICGGSDLVSFDTAHMPPTQVAGMNDAFVLTPHAIGTISIDYTAPTITCPAASFPLCTQSTAPGFTGTPTVMDCDTSPMVTYQDSTNNNVVASPLNSQGWAEWLYGSPLTASTVYRTGPGSPPLGTGSIELRTGANGDGAATIRNPNYDGVRIADLTALSYWTFVSQTGSGGQAPYLVFYVDQDNNGSVDDQLFFEPVYQSVTYFPSNPQAAQADGVWQAWDALHGGWWSGNGDAGATPGTGVKSLATYAAAFPNAVIRNSGGLGGVRFTAGFGAPDWNNFIGSVDAFTIGTGGTSTTYNFELNPVGSCLPVITRTWTATDCAGNSSSCVQNITVTDTTAPSISTEPAVSVSADASTPCGTANAARALTSGWSSAGDVSLVDDARPGNDLALLMKSVPPAPPYDGASLQYTFPVPPTWASITNLSADFAVVSGTFCGGAPRFTVLLDNDNDGVGDTALSGYWGNPNTPPVNFNDGNWHNTGNLANNPFDISGQGGFIYQATRAYTDTQFGASRVLSISVDVDSGWCDSEQVMVDNVDLNGTVQRFNPSYSDDCNAVLTGTRSDSQPLTAPYPQGATTITWSASDCGGNSTSSMQTVTVNNTNDVQVGVQLQGVSAVSHTRCITFQLYTSNCGASPVTVEKTLTFKNGYASGTVTVPCGAYTGITARDRLHTLRRTADDNVVANEDHFGLTRPTLNDYSWDGTSFGIPGAAYYATFIDDRQTISMVQHGSNDALLSGNLNDDRFVDILDFGGFVSRFNTADLANTDCNTTGRHPDFNGDGLVDILDYSHINAQFLQPREADPCNNALNEPGPTTSISVAELGRTDWEMARTADVNRDGILDSGDVAFLGANGLPRCSADYYGDGTVNVQDIFVYLSNWFAGYPGADFNDDRRIQVDDIFTFLNAWFTGCN